MVVDTGRLVWLSVGFCCIGNDMVGVEVTVTGQDKVGVEATGDKVGVEATGYGKEIWVDAGSPILLPTDPEVMTSEKKMKKKNNNHFRCLSSVCTCSLGESQIFQKVYQRDTNC